MSPILASDPAHADGAPQGGNLPVPVHDGEVLRATKASRLREGGRNSWLEIVLDEGKNRQIRRMLEALDIACLRLVRVAIGNLALGELEKGEVRALTAAEVADLRGLTAAAARR